MLELKFCMSTARWKDCLCKEGRPLLPSQGAPLLLGVQPPCIRVRQAFCTVSFLLTWLVLTVRCLLTVSPLSSCGAASITKAKGCS